MYSTRSEHSRRKKDGHVVLPEDHVSERTEELIGRQPSILKEGEPVKEEARRAMSLMREVVELLSRAEVDLAQLLITSRRK